MLALALAAVLAPIAPPGPAEDPREDLAARAHAVLERHCFECHGTARQRGRLRLDAREALLHGGFDGPAVVPGNAESSLLWQRVGSEDESRRMPADGERLADAELDVLRRWIEAGAPWPEGLATPAGADVLATTHWAYRAPVRAALPAVQRADWPRNEVDRFVLARLEAEGLSPSAEASREALVRRVHLDLIGLPPTLEEREDFLRDERDDAYERLVDRLLASPHFGERWAKPWLDAARYADTDGHNIDGARSMGKYRDWVIDAYTQDLPFDRFTVEQIAGDLLPDATESQRIASGFHANTRVNTEGGVDPEEDRFERMLDRVNTTAAVWLGTTLGCAQCHHHKFDPFRQEEYYGLLAYFEHSSQKKITLAEPGPDGKPVTTLVLEEKDDGQVPSAPVRLRGAFTSPGEVVLAHTPAVLHPFREEYPRNRLGLARWLVDERNPLTARVIVNRLWAELFGRGIVATVEDFGSQGLPPSHPELLDWLAVEFREEGWSTKHLLRLLVTSATYRQDSAVSAKALARDPDNRLLGRGARFRLDAETFRDVVLTAAGLLDRRIGGPSVFPLQADTSGVIPINKTSTRWDVSEGPDRYRRGLYTFWRRTFLFTAYAVFDAPSREFCTLRRQRTNTPLQALVGLNDPGFFDAAQGFARRLLREVPAGEAAFERRLDLAFRAAVSRSPTESERTVLARALAAEAEHYTAHADEAERTVGEAGLEFLGEERSAESLAELAAWTILANVVLNLDEVLNRS